MEAIYLSNQAILFWEHRSSLENVFGSWIIPAINEGMIEGSVDLRSILIELLFVVLVEIVEVDGVWAENEVIEWGDADVLIHGIYLDWVNVIFPEIFHDYSESSLFDKDSKYSLAFLAIL